MTYVDKLESGHRLVTRRGLDILPQEYSKKAMFIGLETRKLGKSQSVCCVCVCRHVSTFVIGIKKQSSFYQTLKLGHILHHSGLWY